MVVLPVPPEVEGDVDLVEGARPLLVLLAFDLDLHRLERLLELPEEEHRIESCAAAERREQHLGGSHRGVVAEDRRLIDRDRVARRRLNVEMHLVPIPPRNRFGQDLRTIYAGRHVGGSSHSRWSRQDGSNARGRTDRRIRGKTSTKSTLIWRSP